MIVGESPAITVAICSNRPEDLAGAVARTARLLRSGDHLLIVADMPSGYVPPFPSGTTGLRVLRNGANLGLAHSRNRALKEAVTRYVVFLDDDIAPTTPALERMRAALASGAHVVGTRITADFQGRRCPWFLTAGQLHYLGSHDPAGPASIWGGSFGVDVDQARLLGVAFDERLGRHGGSLASAEDTTFVRQLVSRGARAEVVHDAQVHHLIPPSRLTLSYLLRRAYWQGRSEVRRNDAWRGLAKEWNRNSGNAPRTLAALYTVCVFVGVCREAWARVGRSAGAGECG